MNTVNLPFIIKDDHHERSVMIKQIKQLEELNRHYRQQTSQLKDKIEKSMVREPMKTAWYAIDQVSSNCDQVLFNIHTHTQRVKKHWQTWRWLIHHLMYRAKSLLYVATWHQQYQLKQLDQWLIQLMTSYLIKKWQNQNKRWRHLFQNPLRYHQCLLLYQVQYIIILLYILSSADVPLPPPLPGMNTSLRKPYITNLPLPTLNWVPLRNIENTIFVVSL